MERLLKNKKVAETGNNYLTPKYRVCVNNYNIEDILGGTLESLYNSKQSHLSCRLVTWIGTFEPIMKCAGYDASVQFLRSEARDIFS